MSEAESVGTLASPSEAPPAPELCQQLADATPDALPQSGATEYLVARQPEGTDETLAPTQPISLKGPEVSEDEGNGGSGSAGKKKKQRSMAELIKGLDLNMGDDGVAVDEAPEEEQDAAAGDLLSPSPASTPKSDDKLARKRKKAGEGNGNGEAKGSPASPTTDADQEAQQNASLPDNGASGRRERKKSKYLSPPYTMVIDKKTGAASSGRSAFGNLLDSDDGGTISSPLGRCSSFGRKRKEKEELDLDLDLDSPFVFDEAAPSTDELLAELRCTAVGVVYLVSSPNASAVRGYFALFRGYSYSGATESPTPAKVAPVEEIKTPAYPINADSKMSHQEQDIGDDTKNITKTPVASTEKTPAEETNKSASGKRSYKKKQPAPAVAPTTTESNGTAEVAKPRGRGRPRKKNKENQNAVDGLPLTIVVGLAPMPNSPTEGTCNNTPTHNPAPTPAAPTDSGSNKSAAASPAPTPTADVTELQANGSSSAPVVDDHPNEQNEAKRKKRKRKCGPPGSASLIVTFAPGAELPTKEHLLGFFSKYGALDVARTEVRTAKRVACVTYGSKADAQRAIASPDRDQAFGPGVATFRIKYARQARQIGQGGVATEGVPLPGMAIPRPPLEFVKKSLEGMIAVLEESRPEGSKGPAAMGSVSQEEDPRDYLVDQMSNLLVKVNKLLADGAAVANGGVEAAAAESVSTAAAAAEVGGSAA